MKISLRVLSVANEECCVLYFSLNYAAKVGDYFFFFSSCFTKEEGCIQARCDLKIMPWLYTEIQDYLLLPMAAILNNSPSHSHLGIFSLF